jgi:hypothetical protein
MATSGTKKKAAKKAATTKSTSGRNAKTSLQSLTERATPPNKALVRITTRSVSRATRNQLGQSWVSEDVIAAVPAFIGTQLKAWKRLNDEDRQNFVGWSKALAVQAVHEARALEVLLAQFEAESSGEDDRCTTRQSERPRWCPLSSMLLSSCSPPRCEPCEFRRTVEHARSPRGFRCLGRASWGVFERST